MDETHNLDLCPDCLHYSMQVTPEQFICLRPDCFYLREFTKEGGKMKLTLLGQARGTKNHIQITKEGRRYPTKLFQAWSTYAMLQIWDQLGYAHEIRPYDEPLAIVIDYWPGDGRIRDAPAIQEGIFHVLEGSGVVANDKWFKIVRYKEHAVDKDNPRAEVELWPIAEGF